MRPLVSSLALSIAVLTLATGACSRPQAFPYFYLTVKADWSSEADGAAALGYWVNVQVTKKIDDAGDCSTISGSTRVLINGAVATFAPDSGAGCMRADVGLGPFLQDQPVSVTVEQDGQVVGQAAFDQLMPGVGAALLDPVAGPVHAGDVLVVRPVPELPTSGPIARFYALDEPTWSKAGLYARAERLSDGVHVTVPSFTGRAWFGVETSDYASAEISCAGFASCHGEAAGFLGPFLVTESP